MSAYRATSSPASLKSFTSESSNQCGWVLKRHSPAALLLAHWVVVLPTTTKVSAVMQGWNVHGSTQILHAEGSM